MRRPGIHLFARGQNGGEQHAAAAKRMGSLSSYRVRPTRSASEQCPADRCTAVDKQRLAGDENSIFRQQELDCSCDFVWRAAPVHGNAGQIPFFALAPRRIAGAEQFCFGRAGRHSVDRNASSREFECPCPGGAHQSRLCSRIGGPLVDAKTGIIDDTSPTVRPHPRQRRLRGLNGGLQVKAKDRIECLQFDIGKGLRNPQT